MHQGGTTVLESDVHKGYYYNNKSESSCHNDEKQHSVRRNEWKIIT